MLQIAEASLDAAGQLWCHVALDDCQYMRRRDLIALLHRQRWWMAALGA